jgi:hypothetical protein
MLIVPAGTVGDDRFADPSPEYAPFGFDNAWTFTLNGGSAGTLSQDATGLTFTGAQNLASINHAPSIAFVDGGIYQVTWTLSNRTGGSVQATLHGATTAHGGYGTAQTANGTYTDTLTLQQASSFTNSIRFRAQGANGTNSYKITSVSVKRVG